ncbi:hypothetical protein [Erwinia amylovora]|uniref:hypothetical protein n=1 Tax=Erwinia amylovora TaxID=552 RepID=UPI001F045ED9|nr:hypothetical protein [Erwinia amylovora]
MPESFRLNYPASVKVFFIFGTEFLIDNLVHRDMFSFLSIERAFLMKENIPAVTRTRIEPDCCDSSAVFVLDNGHDHFAVSLETILSCLKMAEEHGHVPALSAEWWCLIANHTAWKYQV